MASKQDATRPTISEESVALLKGMANVIAGSHDPAGGNSAFPEKITSLRIKLEITSLGKVEIDINCCEAKGVSRSESSADAAVSVSALACAPTNAKAADILQTCDDEWSSTKDDCNKFVKAASNPYFGNIFSGLNADGIIDFLKNPANGWSSTQSIATAISNAESGQFVIAGMKSAELGGTNGHVAVVVGCPGQMSGTVIVPIGYAGSLDNPSARIRGARLSGTFPATAVREEKVSYFSRSPTL